MKKSLIEEVKKKALPYYEKAHIVLTEQEKNSLEVADMGLNDIYDIGLELIIYVNTKRYCAKEMVLLPGQTCPEHRHKPLPAVGYQGKQETFRCRYGTVYLYVPGPETPNRACHPEVKRPGCFTVFHEIKLTPGQQHTLEVDTLHWFSSGPEGAVISEFSSPSHDEHDIFTDPLIRRLPEVEE